MNPLDVDLSVLDQWPINTWAFPRILVAPLIERTISYADDVFFPFMEIAAQGPAMIQSKYGRTDATRNFCATKLLMSDYTHLLMLDIDHIHPYDIVQKFAKWTLLRPDVEVISGLNFRRGKPFDPVMGYLSDSGDRPVVTTWGRGLVGPVDEIGAASLFVSRSVFERMEPPWFFNMYHDVWRNNWPGEDIGFSTKCKEYGIPIYVDTTITSPHVTTALITEETFRAYQEAHPEEFGNHAP